MIGTPVRSARAIVLGMWLVTCSGCGKGPGTAAESNPETATVAVGIGTVEPREFADAVAATGNWRASGEFHIAAPFAATLEALGPRVGEKVARGQVVGRLVTRESQAAVRGADLLMREAATPSARDEAARALTLARRDIVRVPLLAGGAGTVSARLAEPGAEVAEGAELLTIVPQGTLVFEAHVPLQAAGRIVPGQSATIAMEGTRPVAARVKARVPSTSAADQAALFWLTPLASVPPEFIDRFGQSAVLVGASHRASAVPDSAVVEDDLTGEHRVAVVEGTGLATWRTVRIGVTSEHWIELLAPALPPGTRVVVRGQRGLPDSTHVRIGS